MDSRACLRRDKLRKLKTFTRKEDSSGKLNDMVRRLELLTKIRGVGGTSVLLSPTGITIKSKQPTLPIRLAFCKTAASSGTSIVCYLDTDETGEEITVECSISGGSDLNTAIPRLTDGLEILVWQINGVWKTNTFQATTDCS